VDFTKLLGWRERSGEEGWESGKVKEPVPFTMFTFSPGSPWGRIMVTVGVSMRHVAKGSSCPIADVPLGRVRGFIVGQRA
jgi:hypothetical protein